MKAVGDTVFELKKQQISHKHKNCKCSQFSKEKKKIQVEPVIISWCRFIDNVVKLQDSIVLQKLCNNRTQNTMHM